MSGQKMNSGQRMRIAKVREMLEFTVTSLRKDGYSASDIVVAMGQLMVSIMRAAGMTMLQVSNQFIDIARLIRERDEKERAGKN